jgi:biopolymer transport protein TolQ
LWRLFAEADFTVQLVMLVLVAASLATWAIFISRYLLIQRMQKKANAFEDLFWSGSSLDKVHGQVDYDDPDPLSAVFISAMREWEQSKASGRLTSEQRANVLVRMTRVMNVAMDRELELLEGISGYLASVGSTAPFIGLFGTVWGIMNSFQSIAANQATNLAVVAPGIAEALFATAMGLVAAIPAVFAYNKISSDVNRFATRIGGFIEEFTTVLSRQLDSKA